MGARGIARDIDAIGISAKALGITMHPRHGAADLVAERQETPPHVLNRGEVRNDEMRTRVDEELGREGGIFGEACAPSAPMDEDVDRSIGAFGGVDVEALDRSATIREA